MSLSCACLLCAVMRCPDLVPLQTGIGVGGITYEGDRDGGEMLLKDSGKLVYITILYI